MGIPKGGFFFFEGEFALKSQSSSLPKCHVSCPLRFHGERERESYQLFVSEKRSIVTILENCNLVKQK